MLQSLWRDESGGVLSAEFLLMTTILVIGLIVGWAALRNAVVSEIEDAADAVAGSDMDDSDPVTFTDAEGASGEIETASAMFGS